MNQSDEYYRNKPTKTGVASDNEQHQDQHPGSEGPMRPAALNEQPDTRSGTRLEGRVALVTGGGSGIGLASADAFACEGADVKILFQKEAQDARDTAERAKEFGRRCGIHHANVGDEAACRSAVGATIECFGKPQETMGGFLTGPQFWFESFQNR